MSLTEITKLERLRSFVTVAESPTYQAAADRLKSAQPTVFKHVQELSKSLGEVSLFHAGTTQLTRDGETLVGPAKRLLEAEAEFRRLAQDIQQGVDGVLRVACYPAHVQHFLAEAAGRYMKKYPNVRLELAPIDDSGTAGKGNLDQLRDRLVDIAIGPKLDEFKGIHLHDAHLVVVVTNEDPRRHDKEVCVSDLADEDLLLAPTAYWSRTSIDRAFADAGISPRVAIEHSSWAPLISLGRNGVGLAIVPSDTLDDPEGLDPYPALTDTGGNRMIKQTWMQWRKDEARPAAVDNFIKFVQDDKQIS